MMRKIYIAALVMLSMVSCDTNKEKKEVLKVDADEISIYSSSDKQLDKAYTWARKMALSYAHHGTDPVGHWYEAALPQRESFCMRDVSHQSIGGEILGLRAHNKNMFTRFAENISADKDWCSYWEINRYNKPCPADYSNDQEFWYNLNANFDVINACYRLYEWTGDSDYLTDTKFNNFYTKSLNEYVDKWQLNPEGIMERPQYMNQPANFNPNNNFHTCRGLASYVENFRNLTVGVDLLATLYAGFDSYSKIAQLNGDYTASEAAMKKALQYQDIMEEKWWCETNTHYNTFWTSDKEFHRGEGVPFILWFNASMYPNRVQASVNDILSREWNVENMSAFPLLFYRLGYHDNAYHYLTSLPYMNRAEYPEVSYGIIEGVVSGAMGINVKASENKIETCSRIGNEAQQIDNLPILDGYISVKHSNGIETEIVNNTSKELVWSVRFVGDYDMVSIDNKLYPLQQEADINGNIISECTVKLPVNEKLVAQALVN